MRQNENHSEYRTYSEAKPVVASPAKMFRIALLSSLSVFVSFVMIGTLVAYGKDDLNSGGVAAFIKQIADHNFRNSVLSVQAIVASVDVALVVISWKKFGRPEDGEPIQLRIWLSRVLEDARRETATAFIMIILAMVTGGLFFSYWASILGQMSAGGLVGGDSIIGAALVAVFIAIAVLPSIVRVSGNETLSGYASLVKSVTCLPRRRIEVFQYARDKVAMSKWKKFGWLVYLWVACTLPTVLSWGILMWEKWGSLTLLLLITLLLVMGALAGAVIYWTFAFVSSAVREDYLRTFCLGLILVFDAIVLISFGCLSWAFWRDEYITIGEAFGVFFGSVYWVLLFLLFTIFWWRVPILHRLGRMYYTKAIDDLIEEYKESSELAGSAYVQSKYSGYLEDMEAIANVLAPESAIIHRVGGRGGRLRSRRWWRRCFTKWWDLCAEIKVPAEWGSPALTQDALDKNLRRRLEQDFGVTFCGSGGAVSEPGKIIRLLNPADAWHMRSALE